MIDVNAVTKTAIQALLPQAFVATIDEQGPDMPRPREDQTVCTIVDLDNGFVSIAMFALDTSQADADIEALTEHFALTPIDAGHGLHLHLLLDDVEDRAMGPLTICQLIFELAIIECRAIA